MLKEIKKKNNERAINEKMEKSFAIRRTKAAIQDLLERWPSLFCENQVNQVLVQAATKCMCDLMSHL